MDAATRAAIERTLWRAEVAERELGCDELKAAYLAADPLVDVCSAREYARKGCPPQLAIELATREPGY